MLVDKHAPGGIPRIDRAAIAAFFGTVGQDLNVSAGLRERHSGPEAREWADDGISVNHVGPGWVDTNINDPSPDFETEEKRAAVRGSIPFGHRSADPREIGEAVARLAASTYTTGAYLRVDGGLVIGKY